MLQIKPLNNLSIHLDHLIKRRLWLKVIIGLILGIGVGTCLNPSSGLFSVSRSQSLGNWLDLPGQIFMRLVQMIMIPLVFASIITGIVSNTSEILKTFILRLLLYFVFTTFVAITIGLSITLIMNPGEYIYSMGGFPNGGGGEIEAVEKASLMENLPNTISNLIPSNPLEAILKGEMLGVVIFTIIIGVAITQLKKETARPIIRFTEALQMICMTVVSWAMKLVPYAVFGLMAALLSRIGVEIIFGLGYYMLVVIIGLFFLLLFYLVLVFRLLR